MLRKEPRVFDLESAAAAHPFKGVAALSGSDPLDVSVAMQPDGSCCAATSKDAGRVWVARLPDADIEPEQTLGGASLSGPRGLAFHPTEPLLAAGYADGTVVVWDLRTGEKAADFHDPDGEIHALAFSPDGRRLATTTPQRSVRVWDWEIGAELVGVRCQSHFALDVAFSPDGEMLAFADGNQASTQLLLGADGAARQARWREYAKGRAACLGNALALDAAHLEWAAKQEALPNVYSLLTPEPRCPAGVDSRPRLAHTLAQRAKPGDLEEACALLEAYLATEPVDDNVRAAVEALAESGSDGPLQERISALGGRAAQ